MAIQSKEVKVKATDEVMKGVYANQTLIMHDKEEFILDFINTFPPSGILNARVIISPAHCVRIMKALQENIQRYEANFGKIQAGSEPDQKIGFHA